MLQTIKSWKFTCIWSKKANVLEVKIWDCCHANNATQLEHAAVAMQNNATKLNDAAVAMHTLHSIKMQLLSWIYQKI